MVRDSPIGLITLVYLDLRHPGDPRDPQDPGENSQPTILLWTSFNLGIKVGSETPLAAPLADSQARELWELAR